MQHTCLSTNFNGEIDESNENLAVHYVNNSKL